MREKKIVLFVVGDEHIWSGCYSVIQEVLFEYHVKYVDNYDRNNRYIHMKTITLPVSRGYKDSFEFKLNKPN